MSTNTGGQAFPGPHWSEGETGMTLLDWMAGQALAGLCSSWYDRHKDDPETQRGHGPALISQSAYTHAEAMLAEKARREATVKESLPVPDHSPDASKTAKQPDVCALLRRFIDAVPEGFETSLLWDLRTEAISLLDKVPDHSPGAGKMVLEAANRELVEELEKFTKAVELFTGDGRKVRSALAILAKHKGAA